MQKKKKIENIWKGNTMSKLRFQELGKVASPMVSLQD